MPLSRLHANPLGMEQLSVLGSSPSLWIPIIPLLDAVVEQCSSGVTLVGENGLACCCIRRYLHDGASVPSSRAPDVHSTVKTGHHCGANGLGTRRLQQCIPRQGACRGVQVKICHSVQRHRQDAEGERVCCCPACLRSLTHSSYFSHRRSCSSLSLPDIRCRPIAPRRDEGPPALIVHQRRCFAVEPKSEFAIQEMNMAVSKRAPNG